MTKILHLIKAFPSFINPNSSDVPFLGLVDVFEFGGDYPVDGRWPGGRVAGGLGFLVHGLEARQLR